MHTRLKTLMTKQITNYLTIDVEDYYQVAAFEKVIRPDQWDNYESRVEHNTNIILGILGKRNIKATFFIVGWIAEKHPEIVRRISNQGHEIGCHSYRHKKIYDLTPEFFKTETQKAKLLLESITGSPVKGYRAPSYSITKKTLWALNILIELGFKYDSSIFPIHHDNYGIPDAHRFPCILESHGIMEYPISTIKILGRNLPVSGGGYFRLLPYALTKAALTHINNKEKQPFIFYVHPWEIDPNQPRIKHAGVLSRFRHYVNLSTTQKKLERLLDDFQFQPLGQN
jgi:polysaccharide deacetylase family protein (PEP-CTERM system associated)